ncbi:alpha/beta fold hydrolase [Stenotrophomonas sp.]|uniref:alpha/beta fold hydrolase n=1 Tax=Stenotrophomonas sp. TaxID=69392 RepID=UPI00289EBB38|nr:alpha/beta fold hydrolase [Stenotrophomonas sp.]
MPLMTTSRGPAHWTETASPADAPPVVLIHGLGGDATFWVAEQHALADRFRVLAVDLRGSGKTPGGTAPFSIEDLAQDVLAIMDAAGIDAAHVVGFSMGGTVAQALALAAPQRVRSLVLAATFAHTGTQAELFLKAIGAVYANGATPKQIFELVLPWLFSDRFLSSPAAAPYLDYPESADDEQDRDDWLRLLQAMLAFDGRPALSRLGMPTLVIGGDEDRLAPQEGVHALVAGLSQATLCMLPGGHLMNVESPQRFADALATHFVAHASTAEFRPAMPA